MKLDNLFNAGACGIEQALYVGSVSFDTEGIADGVKLATVPKNHVITKAVAIVKTAFNAVTTNVLTLGNKVGETYDADALLDSSAITEGTKGAYQKQLWIETGSNDMEIYAEFDETGTAATAGEAEFYIFVMRLPE